MVRDAQLHRRKCGINGPQQVNPVNGAVLVLDPNSASLIIPTICPEQLHTEWMNMGNGANCPGSIDYADGLEQETRNARALNGPSERCESIYDSAAALGSRTKMPQFRPFCGICGPQLDR